MTSDQEPPTITEAVVSALREPGLHLGAGAAVVLFLSTALVPFLGVFFGFFTPLPLIYFYCRRGRLFGLTMISLALVLVTLVYTAAGRPLGGLVFLEYALLAAVTAQGLMWGFSPDRVIGAGAGSVLLLAFVFIVVGGLSQGQSPWTFTREMMNKQLEASLAVYETLLTGKPRPEPVKKGSPDRPSSDRLVYESDRSGSQDLAERSAGGTSAGHQEIQKLFNLLLGIFPGLMVMGTLLVAWANYLMVHTLLSTSGNDLLLPDLKRWQAPEKMVWAVIFCGFAIFLPFTWWRLLGLNGLLILGVLYFFQGLAIASFWLKSKKAPTLLRVVLYLLIVLQPILALIIAIIGLMDLWADFRKLKDAASGADL